MNKVSVSYIPSLTALSYLRSRSRNRTCLAVGYSSKKDSRDFEEEAKSVAKYFGTKPLLGQEATSNNFLHRMHGVDIIHFACHGIFNENDPLDSWLELYSSVITPRDLMKEKLTTSLAVLTACDVGKSATQGVDEQFGFARALFSAGISSVIAPCMRLESTAAKFFSQVFYRNLIEKQMPIAFAMQSAQLEMIATPEFRDEGYWAPLMLMGSSLFHEEKGEN